MARRGTRSLCLFPMSVRMVGLDATCNGSHVPVAAVSSGDGETHCSKVRSNHSSKIAVRPSSAVG